MFQSSVIQGIGHSLTFERPDEISEYVNRRINSWLNNGLISPYTTKNKPLCYAILILILLSLPLFSVAQILIVML